MQDDRRSVVRLGFLVFIMTKKSDQRIEICPCSRTCRSALDCESPTWLVRTSNISHSHTASASRVDTPMPNTNVTNTESASSIRLLDPFRTDIRNPQQFQETRTRSWPNRATVIKYPYCDQSMFRDHSVRVPILNGTSERFPSRRVSFDRISQECRVLQNFGPPWVSHNENCAIPDSHGSDGLAECWYRDVSARRFPLPRRFDESIAVVWA